MPLRCENTQCRGHGIVHPDPDFTLHAGEIVLCGLCGSPVAACELTPWTEEKIIAYLTGGTNADPTN